jgi:transposase InsO family protein
MRKRNRQREVRPLQDRALSLPGRARGLRRSLEELDDLEIATCAWVSWSNEERIHGELDDLTPAEVEADYIVQSEATAA